MIIGAVSPLPSPPAFIDAAGIDQCLDFGALRASMARAFSGAFISPPRQHYGLGEATQLLMPAWSADAPAAGSFIGTKIVSVHPDNCHRQLPTVQGLFVLQAGDTGLPLAVLDAARLTLWRTAATSALAAGFLARDNAETLLMVGAGQLAPFLVNAHHNVRPLRRVLLWNRNRAAAERLATLLQQSPPGISPPVISVVDGLREAVAEADIISCATLARAPLVCGAWLKAGVHLDLVGAFAPGMREVDDAALVDARIFLDTAAAQQEGGDVADALKSGVLSPKYISGVLADLCLSRRTGREHAGQITLFKSIGAAIEDLAAAVLVWQNHAQI